MTRGTDMYRRREEAYHYTHTWVGAVGVQHIWGPPVWTRIRCALAAVFSPKKRVFGGPKGHFGSFLAPYPLNLPLAGTCLLLRCVLPLK